MESKHPYYLLVVEIAKKLQHKMARLGSLVPLLVSANLKANVCVLYLAIALQVDRNGQLKNCFETHAMLTIIFFDRKQNVRCRSAAA